MVTLMLSWRNCCGPGKSTYPGTESASWIVMRSGGADGLGHDVVR
jgi:hypothetical protein